VAGLARGGAFNRPARAAHRDKFLRGCLITGSAAEMPAVLPKYRHAYSSDERNSMIFRCSGRQANCFVWLKDSAEDCRFIVELEMDQSCPFAFKNFVLAVDRGKCEFEADRQAAISPS